MRFIKWLLLFLAAFVAAWVTISTFRQQPFLARVPAIVLWHQTAPYPVYLYLVAAFVIGLAIGTVMTLYYYVSFSNATRARKRELQDMAAQNVQLRAELERTLRECNELRERSALRKTERMAALPPRLAPSVGLSSPADRTSAVPCTPTLPDSHGGTPSTPGQSAGQALPPKNVDRLWK